MSFEKTEKPVPPTNDIHQFDHQSESRQISAELLFESFSKQWAFDSNPYPLCDFVFEQQSSEGLSPLIQTRPNENLIVQDNQRQAQFFPFIFNQKVLTHDKNTPRLHTRTAIKYLPLEQFDQIPGLQLKMAEMCKFWESWHLSQRRNVFLITHLRKLLEEGNELTKTESKQVRKALNKILRNHTLDMLKEPKSQIKEHRIDYLRSSKVYSLRCRHPELIQRNESR